MGEDQLLREVFGEGVELKFPGYGVPVNDAQLFTAQDGVKEVGCGQGPGPSLLVLPRSGMELL